MRYGHDANVALAIVGVALSLVFCLLRYYTRIVLLKGFGLDDYFSVMALVRATPLRHVCCS